MKQALVNCRLFDAASERHDAGLVIDGGRIDTVTGDPAVLRDVDDTLDLDGLLVVPGFVDLQVNGGGGKLFNDEPTVATLRTMMQAHRPRGTTACLPTLISDDVATMRAGMAAVAEAIADGVPGILGIHLEGPHLNPARPGVHDARQMRTLDARALELLGAFDAGPTLVTLAPEMVVGESIRQLHGRGVRVFAGHSDATYDQVRAAIDCGLAGFTHLFNAMSPLQTREPGVVGAALDDPATFAGIIADGHHVHPATLGIALRAKPRGKIFLVTDAMPTVGSDNPTFTLNSVTVNLSAGRCVTGDGTLAGSNIGMIDAVKYLVSSGLVDRDEAIRMASAYPAAALGVDNRIGYVQAGYRADLLALDDDLNVVLSIIDGRVEHFD